MYLYKLSAAQTLILGEGRVVNRNRVSSVCFCDYSMMNDIDVNDGAHVHFKFFLHSVDTVTERRMMSS